MKRVLVLYGGVSPEHEVSIVTALQVMAALKGAGFEVWPGYVSKQGEWRLGDGRFLRPEAYADLNKIADRGKAFSLEKGGLKIEGWRQQRQKIEAVFPVFHGRNGEDGAVQGYLELVNLPYVGCGVTASSLGIDKYLSKRVAAKLGLRVVEDVLVGQDWKKKESEIKKLGLPVFVKPNCLGSSIGVSRVDKWTKLAEAIEVGLCFDSRVLVEKAIEKPVEVNISILGNDPYELSISEEPVREEGGLSFDDKYLGQTKSKGMAGAKRYMPARVGAKMLKEIEIKTGDFFRAIGGRGISRIDYMVDKRGRLFFNEINTMPGSLAFYLWKEKGLGFETLVKRLVDLAIDEWREKQKRVTVFESNILANFGKPGLKGGKV